MIAPSTEPLRIGPRYRGLRMTADEYLRLQDDGFWYELVDGVVQYVPSPSARHQKLVADLVARIGPHVEKKGLGAVFVELDVHLGRSRSGGDLVYRPDIMFVRTDRLPKPLDRIVGPPDLIIEIVSPDSRGYDAVTKRDDYERHGVHEYWLIDPDASTMTFYRLLRGRFVEIKPVRGRFKSEAVAGFVLNLARVRQSF